MFTKGLFHALDVKDGRDSKVQILLTCVMQGDPVEVGAHTAGKEPMNCIPDITASSDARNTKAEMVRKVGKRSLFLLLLAGDKNNR